MTFQFWFCVTVTIVSALTSTGFSFAALYGSAGSNRTNAMYVTSRSVALVVIAQFPSSIPPRPGPKRQHWRWSSFRPVMPPSVACNVIS